MGPDSFSGLFGSGESIAFFSLGTQEGEKKPQNPTEKEFP